MADDFWKKYKHPLWQEKRLRIMERAGFICEHCGTQDQTLNVHHSYYEKNRDPWDYPDYSLRCLCDACHERHHELSKELRQYASFLPEANMIRAIGYLKGLIASDYNYEYLVDVCSELEALGFADAVGADYFKFSWPWKVDVSLPRYGTWDADGTVTTVSFMGVMKHDEEFQSLLHDDLATASTG